MIEDSEDRKGIARAIELKQDMRDASTQEGITKAATELLFHRNDIRTAEPDPIKARVIEELLTNPSQYADLLDICDGNERTAADMVVSHMIELGKLGKEWIMSRAMGHLQSLAHRVRWRKGG